MARQTKLTAKRKAEFLASLSQGASVTRAAGPVLVSRWSLYDHRNKDPEFAEAWDRAVEDGADKLEDEARRRAYEGVDEPVFHRGIQCGIIKRYSDTLLIFLLKGLRPEKYRDSAPVNIDIGRKVSVYFHTPPPSGDSQATVPLQAIDNNGTYELALDAHSSEKCHLVSPSAECRILGSHPTGVGERSQEKAGPEQLGTEGSSLTSDAIYEP